MNTGDYITIALSYLFGTQSVMVIAYIPTQVELTRLVPPNIETTTMAVVTGVFILSYEYGAKSMTALLCSIFDVFIKEN